MQKVKALVELLNVGVAYHKAAPLFQKVTLRFTRGGLYCVTGASGSGKSTFLKLLYGDVSFFTGQARLFGHHMDGLSFHRQAHLRRKIGIVFQDQQLLDVLNVEDNVSLPLRLRGVPQHKSLAQARDVLNWMGVHAFKRHPKHLSGGECQRVALARAVIAHPSLLLLDEPFGNVDQETTSHLLYFLSELHKMGTTIVMATHDTHILEGLVHTTFAIDAQRIVQKPQSYPGHSRASTYHREVA